jgi:hypothetical protein
MGKAGNSVKVATNSVGLAGNRAMYGVKFVLNKILSAVLFVAAAINKASIAVGAVIGLFVFQGIVYDGYAFGNVIKSVGYAFSDGKVVPLLIFVVVSAVALKVVAKLLHRFIFGIEFKVYESLRNTEDAIVKNRVNIADGMNVLNYGSEDAYIQAEMQKFMSGTNYVER